ncbi:phosphoenolpyruvate-protein phosphotransferase PtsI [Buchnera aphidicola (Thelaxes californica)]|uniref:Phosphoenolpyruvate-protein phosphotransferase n=1 Tax=Buchnera aphidicola (Thelaxes californica) TaxID=1315998 RepID=A0A4D6YB33_9GAMM|nr:phosphoenolpyruvate-protein phosphotransferase PtsI [Buchnera aphidicola]QCI26609.1 phosphoenolpyruvate-protein phosphotransferase PtsI [Buchnera aphidicola (Thelaxes californica)]
MISGISVSPGIVIGKALLIQEQQFFINNKKILKKNIDQEIKKFFEARKKTIKEIELIQKKNSKKIEKHQCSIFEGHIMLIEDEEFEQEILLLIQNKHYSAEYSVNQVIEKQALELEKLKDEYLKNRAIDIQDIGNRLIKNILNIENINLENVDHNTILVKRDLTPSETAQINLKKIIGLITDLGSHTSHTSIIACSLEIPTIVGTTNATQKIKNGDIIILDSINNEIHINPEDTTITLKKEIKKKFLYQKQQLKKIKNLFAITLDKHRVEIGANISTPQDIEGAINNGAECIGLYRTEFLFMGRQHLPSENEQFEVYKMVATKMEKKPVIIRTMDIGGDKNLPYIKLPKEENPFLGCRAIRISMMKKEILYDQIKAILRASIFGKLKIMFPMIISVEEVKILKLEIDKIKQQLYEKKCLFDESIKIGVMIETPAAAMLSHHLAKEVDFFSIGSNDLTQYTLAVDRGNDLIANLYDPMSPSVLNLIQTVIHSAHKEKKWAGICGELASDERATALLLGMGIDEFSMSASCIPKIKNIIRNSNFQQCKKIAEKALKQPTSQKLISTIQPLIKKYDEISF